MTRAEDPVHERAEGARLAGGGGGRLADEGVRAHVHGGLVVGLLGLGRGRGRASFVFPLINEIKLEKRKPLYLSLSPSSKAISLNPKPQTSDPKTLRP